MGSNQGRPIDVLRFKPLSRFSYSYSLILYCPLKLKYTCMFSVSTNSLFGHVLRFSAHAHVYDCICTCPQCHVCRCARIMQIHIIPMIAEVKVLQRKTCFMCTICKLWYAECSNGTMNNNIYCHTLISTECTFKHCTLTNKAVGTI